jgi:HEAT repeat protein
LEEYPLSKRIIDALSRYKKRALSHLLPLCDHADFQVRQSVELYLQMLVQQLDGSNAQIKRALLQLAKDEHPIIAQLALETLGAIHTTSIRPSLLNLLQANPQSFGDIVTGIFSHFPKRSVLQAVMPYLDEQDDTILPYYLKILGYAGVRLEILKKFFKHSNPQIQHASILAVGCTGNPEGIPLLLPFIMSRQHSQVRCIATRSLQHLITALGSKLPKPKNIFDALFVMLNTYKNEEELASVAQALGTLCSYQYNEITEVNVAVVRGRLLDLLSSGVSMTTQVYILQALRGIIDISSYPIIRALRRTNSLEVQKIIAALYGQFPKDLRVIADVSDMISHSEFSIRKFWILTAGKLCAIELADMLVPLLADPNFRIEAFQAITMMGAAILPRLVGWLNHEDPRIQKMAALVIARISQDRIDAFCTVPQA